MQENCWILYHFKPQYYHTETGIFQLVTLFRRIKAEKLPNSLFKIILFHRLYISRKIVELNRHRMKKINLDKDG